MPRSYSTLTLDDAKHMLSAAEAKAASFGIAYNIAVVDAGGLLRLVFFRDEFDDCVVGSQFDIYCLHHPVLRNPQ